MLSLYAGVCPLESIRTVVRIGSHGSLMRGAGRPRGHGEQDGKTRVSG